MGLNCGASKLVMSCPFEFNCSPYFRIGYVLRKKLMVINKSVVTKMSPLMGR